MHKQSTHRTVLRTLCCCLVKRQQLLGVAQSAISNVTFVAIHILSLDHCALNGISEVSSPREYPTSENTDRRVRSRQVWGRSSRPPPLASGLGLLLPATAPYLRRGVAPLGHSCALSVSPTQSRVGSIIGATLTLRVKFAQDIPFVHDSQPALWNWLKVKVTQSCSTVCDPMDYTVRGILQATILDWVAFPFSRGSSQPRDWTQVSHIPPTGGFFTSWATREAPISVKSESKYSS